MSVALRNFLALWSLQTGLLVAQSTNGFFTGRVRDVETQLPLPQARVVLSHARFLASAHVRAGDNGEFTSPPLPPGVYKLEASLDQYQTAQLQDVELAVSGYTEIDFELRRLSTVWEPGRWASAYLSERFLVDFYGPDVALLQRYLVPTPQNLSTLEATASRVVDPEQLRDLPFNGRDVFTMLVAAPAVSADAATARGLGLAVNGQRSVSAHFLLDGVDANNSLLSGPLLAVAPEAVQEYRISTANWSAEYGNASGVIANVVTRGGGDRWHGISYFNLRNESLNANGFQDNLNGRKRRPLRELQPGAFIGGPLRSERLFLSSSVDFVRNRTRMAPIGLQVPSTRFVSIYTDGSSAARSLLERFPAPIIDAGVLPTGTYTVEPPASLDRMLLLERLDWLLGQHRLTGRVASSSLTRPDFIWTPYRDFVSPLEQAATNLSFSFSSVFSSRRSSEFRASWAGFQIGWERPHPEIPTLSTAEGVILPGSPAFYEFAHHSGHWEMSEQLVHTTGRHLFKLGAAFQRRGLRGYLTAGRDGHYRFGTVIDFAIGRPRSFSIATARQSAQGLKIPAFGRNWALHQFSWYVQDSFRMSRTLSFNLGLRVESFGAPAAGPDPLLCLGPGSAMADRLATATLAFDSGGRVYPSNWNLAPRLGISFDPFASGRVIVRAAIGLFHDRPFDNLWLNIRNNSIRLRTFDFRGPDHSFLRPVREALALYSSAASPNDFPNITAFDPDIGNGYARSAFVAVGTRLGADWLIEASFRNSAGRRLLVTDQVNRPFSLPASAARHDNPDRVYNPDLPVIAYRSGLGRSSYSALTSSISHRGFRRQFQAAYTFSHAIDNQSDALAGDFFDLDFTRIRPVQGRRIAAFTKQFDDEFDRGNADFDQRHNLVLYAITELPNAFRAFGLLREWKFSTLAGFRSGFPYSVIANSTVPDSGGAILNNRADLLNPKGSLLPYASEVLGGRQLLDPSAFSQPKSGQIGNLGRNTLAAPGFFNIDVSIAKSIRMRRLGENVLVTFRADVFNILNHVNLDAPDAILSSPTFGRAQYGRRGTDSNFPSQVPFQETSRQVQLIIRLNF